MSGKPARDIFADVGMRHQDQDPSSSERAADEFRRGDIMVRLPYRVRRELQQLAFDRQTTVQSLMQEAINLLMLHHDKNPLI